MAAGYSGRPLYAKLGWKEGETLSASNPPDAFIEWLGGTLGEITPDFPTGFRLGIAFLLTQADLDHAIKTIVPKLAADGTLWVSWPKKSSPLVKELDFDKVQQSLIAAGLVDVKVCAVSEDFSGLKFMVPKKDRALWQPL